MRTDGMLTYLIVARKEGSGGGEGASRGELGCAVEHVGATKGRSAGRGTSRCSRWQWAA